MSGPIILASTSASRRTMLAAAGIPFETDAPHVDEDAVKAACAGWPVRDIADRLAELKATKASARHPGRFVLGADSMVALDRITHLDKPGSMAGLAAQLTALRGRSHQLISAAVIARDGQAIWRHVDHATLHMRAFSDAFLDAYVTDHAHAVQDSVGGYHLEAAGTQLFTRIDGDYFTIRGLPLLPLLGFLRQHGLMPE